MSHPTPLANSGAEVLEAPKGANFFLAQEKFFDWPKAQRKTWPNHLSTHILTLSTPHHSSLVLGSLALLPCSGSNSSGLQNTGPQSDPPVGARLGR